MKHLAKALATFLLLFAATLHAQIYNLRGTDIALSGAGQFNSSLNNPQRDAHETATKSLGFLATFRDHPVTKLDIEFNYQYSSVSDNFITADGSSAFNVPVAFHEFTAAYVWRSHNSVTRPFRPRLFVGFGGGGIYFNPSNNAHTQFRPTGFCDVGVDIPTRNPHLTYRVQGRALGYLAPDFGNPIIASSRYVTTYEPAIGVAFHL